MGIEGGDRMKIPVNETADCSGTTVEIKIKTLDSQTYSLRVDKCVPVPELKRQIVSLTGVVSERQRLICCGRVLKDDQLLSAYHVEDGHTLHLVIGQPIAVTSADAVEADTQSNSGNQSGPGTLIGTFNLVEDGDGGFPDLNRIVSAVFNSVGVTGFGSGGEGLDLQHSPLEFLSSPPRRSPSDLPAPAAPPIEPPTIPDSLSTLSQYVSHLTQEFLTHDGNAQNAGLPVNAGVGLGSVLNSSESRRPFLPEYLSEVISSTRELLVGQASERLQQLARQLELQSSVTDHLERSRIQSRAVRSGVLIQNLGALLLELGRAIMTLRMGRAPSDALVNAGPPFFISATSPNQIMVQSLPLQMGATAGSFPLGVVQNGVGSPPSFSSSGFPPRNIDIRIRTGAFMPRREPVGARNHGQAAVSSGTSQQDGASNNGNSGFSDSYGRPIPIRNVVARFPSSNGNGTDSSHPPLGTFHPLFAMSHRAFSGAFTGLRPPQTAEQHVHNADRTHPDPAPRENGNSVPASGNSTLTSATPNGEDAQVRTTQERIIHDDFTAEAAQGRATEESASAVGDDATFLSHMLRHVLPIIANASGTEPNFPFSEGTSNGETQGDENPDTSSDPPNPKRQKLD